MQLGEYRRLPASLVVLLIPGASYLHQACLLQSEELAMDRANAPLRQPNHLGALKTAIRLSEEESQNTLLNGREQGIGQAAGRGRSSHFGKDHTRFRNARQRHIACLR